MKLSILLIAFLLFLGVKQSFAQDTSRAYSHFQRINLGKQSRTDSAEYKLEFFKIDEEKNLLVTKKGESPMRFIGDEILGAEDIEDTSYVYYSGREISPVQQDVKIALVFIQGNLALLGVSFSEGTLFFFIDPAKL